MLPSPITTNMSSSSAGNSARHSDGSMSDGDDIFMTIDTNNGTEFFAVEPPRVLDEIDSFQKERQISVDPISLQGSSGATVRQASFRLVSPPTKGSGFNQNHPVPSPPSKLKIVSTSSLPSSASSSPSSSRSKNLKPSSNSYHNKIKFSLSRMKSAMDDSHIPVREAESRRSRSYCEPRSSNAVDDFDLFLPKNKNNPLNSQHSMTNPRNNSKPPLGKPKENHDLRKSKSRDQDFHEDGFKCGKLCLFLPRKGGKPVRSSSSASHGSQLSRMTEPPAISRTVSLERFECGSWSEIEEGKGVESPNLFFDLPLELLRCSVSDMQSPVTAAFVFDDDNDNGDHGSTSKDKEVISSDFEAFLEAQAA